jgi:hypothetical protein
MQRIFAYLGSTVIGECNDYLPFALFHFLWSSKNELLVGRGKNIPWVGEWWGMTLSSCASWQYL